MSRLFQKESRILKELLRVGPQASTYTASKKTRLTYETQWPKVCMVHQRHALQLGPLTAQIRPHLAIPHSRQVDASWSLSDATVANNRIGQ